MRLNVCPVSASPATDASSASGIDVNTISDDRQLPRKISTTNATRAATTIASFSTLSTAFSMNTD